MFMTGSPNWESKPEVQTGSPSQKSKLESKPEVQTGGVLLERGGEFAVL